MDNEKNAKMRILFTYGHDHHLIIMKTNKKISVM